MNESLPPVSTNIHELAKSAKARHEEAARSEWHQQMMAEMEAFEASDYQDTGVLHAGEERKAQGTPAPALDAAVEKPTPLSKKHEEATEQQEATYVQQNSTESQEQRRRPLQWARRVGRTALKFVRSNKETDDKNPNRQNHETAPAPDVSAKNLDLLRNAGRAGELLLPYYKFALQESPELATTTIIDDPALTARAHFTDGRHEVRVPLTENAPEQLRDMLATDPASLQAIAQTMEIAPDVLLRRPDLIYIQATLHELGHTVQYNQYSGRREEFQHLRQTQLAQLPVPDYQSVTRLRKELHDPDTEVSEWVRSNWDSLKEKYKVSSVDDLVAVHAVAKRKLFHEEFADQYAARIIRKYEENQQLQAA